MKNSLVMIFSILVTVTCSKAQIPVSVAAVGGITDLMEEWEILFEELNPKYDLIVSYGSGGKLYSQIASGAEYEIFLSADEYYPEQAYEAGFGITDPEIYARGYLIVLSTRKLDASAGLSMLTQSEFETVAVPNPEVGIHGRTAFQVISNAGLTDVIPKLVYAENMPQTVQYILTAADIGFVGYQILFSESMKEYTNREHWFLIDDTLYEPCYYSFVILKNTDGAKKLAQFIRSEEAESVLESKGYDSE